MISSYINREIEGEILSHFHKKREDQSTGLMLSGIVGCGKTTVIEHCLSVLQSRFEIFRFTGDDIQFRKELAGNSRYLKDVVMSQTTRPALLFVDEIQKTEDVFDAVKIAFDTKRISFILSGSNPEYLNSAAKKRLQRRFSYMQMLPFSLSELVCPKIGLSAVEHIQVVQSLLFNPKAAIKIPTLSRPTDLTVLVEDYLAFGGLPLSVLNSDKKMRLQAIQNVVERGFDLMHEDTRNISEIVKLELARLQSREFGYQGLFQRTGVRSRDVINKTILQLENHGYLYEKSPMFPGAKRRSYLVSYSFIDPGVVSYLDRFPADRTELGHRLEGYILARLAFHQSLHPQKSMLGYYKPYQVNENGSTRFIPGEIDFLLESQGNFLPLEVKLADRTGEIDTQTISEFIAKYRCKMGIVLYGGVPNMDAEKKLLFWPYWLF